MKKNWIIILVLGIITLVCVVVGIIFGFGHEEIIVSNKSKLVNNGWGKRLYQGYLNGNLGNWNDSFDEHPYLNMTDEQFIYCYLSIPGWLNEENKHICEYYNYKMTNEYMIVYGFHGKKEEKMYYELKDNDNILILKYKDGDYDIVETYSKGK